MTDQMQTIRDDIAYLRALAEDGREDQSRRGGVIMLAAGLVWSSCAVLQWAALTGRIGEGVATGGWLLGSVLFFGALFWTIRRDGKRSGRSKALGLAWSGVGWTIFVLLAAIFVATWRTHSQLLISFFPSIILALYGAAWSVAAALFGKGWLKLTCIGSFLMSVVCAWFIADPVQYLVYAAALLLLAALPGLVMMRQDAHGQPLRVEG
jgi:hypothetical protein